MSLFKDLLECNKNIEEGTTNINEGAKENSNEDITESVLCEDLSSANETELMSLSICEECGAMHEAGTEVCDCGCESLEEAVKLVVRGGKVIRKQMKRKKRMSSKQKQALAKNRKKAHTGSANKARAKSMKVRSKKVKESEEFACPACDYIGEMEEVEDGVFVCPECGAELEIDDTDEACQEKDEKITPAKKRGPYKKPTHLGKGKKEGSDEEDVANESVEEVSEALKMYVETLDIDQEIVNKGDKAVKAFLIKEYGIFC